MTLSSIFGGKALKALSIVNPVCLDQLEGKSWALADLVCHKEVAKFLKTLPNGSTLRPDRINVSWAKTLPPGELCQWFTLFLP